MKYYIIVCLMYLLSSCNTSHLLSKVVENQASYLESINKEWDSSYGQINEPLKDVASKIELKINTLDKTFFRNDTIYLLGSYDYETGYVDGQIWSGNEFYSFEIRQEINAPVRVKVQKGIFRNFKGIDNLFEYCERIKFVDKELIPGEVDGGYYFLLSRIINSKKLKIQTRGFEEK